MQLTLPYPPSTNNLYFTKGKLRCLTSEGKRFKNTVALLARAQGVRPLDGELALYVDIYRPQRSGDLDNRLKAVQDALSGVAYKDDGQIVGIYARRFEDKKNPRAEVTVMLASQCRGIERD